ncbi:MAG: DNA-directed RNA polymerase [Candidatus Rokubacteria bacterium]|nr:DNA-directed RNA polymerase [Candidatus Rokubacteria bacterium]
MGRPPAESGRFCHGDGGHGRGDRRWRAGLTRFAMEHDGYGTVAADVPMLAKVLRESFVTMYQRHDVLMSLAELVNGVSPREQALT